MPDISSPEIVLSFALAPGALTDVSVSLAVTGLAPRVFTRSVLSMPAELLLHFRDAKLAPVQRDALVALVTDWLLPAGDVPDDLATTLSAALKTGWQQIVLRYDPGAMPWLLDVPFELATPAGDTLPLLFRDNVSGLVHELDASGESATPWVPRRWPARVLVVRSSPTGLDPVPEAQGLCDEIRKRCEPSGASVSFTVLSREAGAAALPTKDNVARALTDLRPDIFVFLGHGNVEVVGTDPNPIPVLYLETDTAWPARAETNYLRPLLDQRDRSSVPLVLLIGCLTGARTPRPSAPNEGPVGRGMAQTLITASTGVRTVIGTRTRFEATRATAFTARFFEVLLKPSPGGLRGDVDRALREARLTVYESDVHDVGCFAPVACRSARTQGPMFQELGVAVEADVPREGVWQKLAACDYDPPGAESDDSPTKVARDALDKVDAQAVAKASVDGVTVFAVRRAEVAAPGTATVTVSVYGVTGEGSYEGTVRFVGANVRARNARASTAIDASPWEFMPGDKHAGRLDFKLCPPGDGAACALPAGELFSFDVTLGDVGPVVYDVDIEMLPAGRTPAPRLYNNAIIVYKNARAGA